MIVSGQYVPSLFILIHPANVKKEFRILLNKLVGEIGD